MLAGHSLPGEWTPECAGYQANNLGVCRGNDEFGGASRRRSFGQTFSDTRCDFYMKQSTDIEILSSLMMYPMPYPSPVTGPNPNNLSAGFPQFEVDKTDVDSNAQPGSVKMLGIVCLLL